MAFPGGNACGYRTLKWNCQWHLLNCRSVKLRAGEFVSHGVSWRCFFLRCPMSFMLHKRHLRNQRNYQTRVNQWTLRRHIWNTWTICTSERWTSRHFVYDAAFTMQNNNVICCITVWNTSSRGGGLSNVTSPERSKLYLLRSFIHLSVTQRRKYCRLDLYFLHTSAYASQDT